VVAIQRRGRRDLTRIKVNFEHRRAGEPNVNNFFQQDGKNLFRPLGRDQAQRSGLTRGSLINDLLAYSRVGTQGKPLTPTDASEVLRRVLANLKIAIEESGAIVRHSNLPTVMGDATQLTQLLQNLISNAIKFRDQRQPEILLQAERVTETRICPEDPPRPAWRFSVRDNGIGIEPQYFNRIFIIFQRLHGRGDYPGTGIGLAICKKIVERHGGCIWVESELGKGATFYFTIPAADEARP